MRDAGSGRAFCDGSRAERRVVSGVSTNVTPSSAARVKSGNDIGSWSDDQQDTLHTCETGCRRSRGDFASYSLKLVTGGRQGCRQEVASNISVAIKNASLMQLLESNRAHLELGHFARRVECGIREVVGRLFAAPMKRNEDGVFTNRRGDLDDERRRSPARGQDDAIARREPGRVRCRWMNLRHGFARQFLQRSQASRLRPRLVLSEQPARCEIQRVISGYRLGNRSMRDRMKPGAAALGGKRIGEEPGRARVIERRAGPKNAAS